MRTPSKYTPGHGTPSSQRRSWLDHAAKAEARTVCFYMKRGKEPRAADRRKNRKSWKAQAKILKRAGRSRRNRRRIMAAGYEMKQEARSAAAGLRGAHGKGFAASGFKRLGEAARKAAELMERLGAAIAAAMALTDEERRAFREEGVMPEGWRWCWDCGGEGTITTMGGDPDLTETSRPCLRCEAEHGIVPEAPPVPTLSAAEAFAVHEAEHSGPMEACPHQLCQWASLLGAP